MSPFLESADRAGSSGTVAFAVAKDPDFAVVPPAAALALVVAPFAAVPPTCVPLAAALVAAAVLEVLLGEDAGPISAVSFSEGRAITGTVAFAVAKDPDFAVVLPAAALALVVAPFAAVPPTCVPLAAAVVPLAAALVAATACAVLLGEDVELPAFL